MSVQNPHHTYRIIRSLEEEALKNRSFAVRLADRLTEIFGSFTFFIANVIFFILWILINRGQFPGFPIFDPYPYTLLTTFVSLEAIVLSIIVLLSQNRQSVVSTLREELHLQVNLIAEKEITKVLKLLHDLHRHHKILQNDPELEEMIQDLDASYLEKQLRKKLTPPKEDALRLVTDPMRRITHEVERTISGNNK